MHTEKRRGSETFPKVGNEATKMMSEEDLSSRPMDRNPSDVDINDTRDTVSSSTEFEGEASVVGVTSKDSHSIGIDTQEQEDKILDTTSNVTSNVTSNDEPFQGNNVTKATESGGE